MGSWGVRLTRLDCNVASFCTLCHGHFLWFNCLFCYLFQLLAYLSLESIRRKYLISCHLVQYDVTVTLYIRGGGDFVHFLQRFLVLSNPERRASQHLFSKKAPFFDHSHRISRGHLFKVTLKLFQCALGLFIFFLFSLSVNLVPPCKLQTCAFIHLISFQQKKTR